MTALAPALSAPPLTISLLELSDSFANLWPALAEEFGATIARVREPNDWFAARADIRVASIGGAEREFLTVLENQGGDDRGPMVAIGADPGHRTAMALVKAGVEHYFALPEDLSLVRSCIREKVESLSRQESRRSFAAREEAKYRFDGLLGTSPALKQALEMAARVIPRPLITVMITGETGTGKELLARAVHYNGPRRDAPFVDINCAAIPEHLLESELFGHEKGAFTGAISAKPGLFEVANGGTVFLDEIGHLPMTLQGKLLRTLEQRTIRRVGGMRTIPIDIRIVAATHVDLPDAVRRGEFREDLYYRLNVLPIHLPALRARDGDVMMLAQHFLEKFAVDYNLPLPILTPGAQAKLKEYPWPGNVRELRNMMERTLLMVPGPKIEGADLSFRTQTAAPATAQLPFPATMREIASGAAKAMVEQFQGNKSAAARRLAISRTRLLRLLDNSGNDPDFQEDLV